MFNLLLDMGDNEIGTAHIQLRRNFNNSPDLFCETKWYGSKQIAMLPLTVIELRFHLLYDCTCQKKQAAH